MTQDIADIDTGANEDLIINNGWYTNIKAGLGNDTIISGGRKGNIDAGMGDDAIRLGMPESINWLYNGNNSTIQTYIAPISVLPLSMFGENYDYYRYYQFTNTDVDIFYGYTKQQYDHIANHVDAGTGNDTIENGLNSTTIEAFNCSESLT